MPHKPLRPCTFPGCSALTAGGRCPQHTRREYDERRGSSTQRGYNARWQRYRLVYLREHPICVECEKNGVIKPSEHVDHIKAVTGPDDPRFYDPANHQALCHSCHSKKTNAEDGGFGRKKK